MCRYDRSLTNPPHTPDTEDDNFNRVYQVLLGEVINDNVYFKKQNLCKHHVLHGHCGMKDCCLYDHPDDLMCFFTGIPGTPQRRLMVPRARTPTCTPFRHARSW